MALGSHKLFQLLENFSPEELKDFRKFISSPVYSSGRNYLPLLDELLKARSKKIPLQLASTIKSTPEKNTAAKHKRTDSPNYSDLVKNF
ncbi:MAG: hypothetical protein IPG02_12425 [Ignavibacteria bacterium]|nr:hypothetical protein [Ignavibacteria bacterium]